MGRAALDRGRDSRRAEFRPTRAPRLVRAARRCDLTVYAAGPSAVDAISIVNSVRQNPTRREIRSGANGDYCDHTDRRRSVTRQLKNCSHNFLLLTLVIPRTSEVIGRLQNAAPRRSMFWTGSRVRRRHHWRYCKVVSPKLDVKYVRCPPYEYKRCRSRKRNRRGDKMPHNFYWRTASRWFSLGPGRR